MIVNGKKYDIDDLIKTIDFDKNNMVGSGKYLLTKEEVSILKRNGIDYKDYASYNDLMIAIENAEDDEYEELDYVLDKISERNYYANTRK